MSGFGRKNYTVAEATARLERYCAYQDRCHLEVRNKLREMRMIPEAADTILVHLIQGDFLNEERFALNYTRGKHRQKSWGPIRISRELQAREISGYLIQKALTGIPEADWDRCFDQLAQKRWAALEGKPVLERKRKFHDYLLYRGWEADRIFGFLRKVRIAER